MIRCLFTLFFCMLFVNGSAQHMVQIINKVSGKAVAFANISLVHDKDTKQLVADADGKFSIPFSENIAVSISHLSFQTFQQFYHNPPDTILLLEQLEQLAMVTVTAKIGELIKAPLRPIRTLSGEQLERSMSMASILETEAGISIARDPALGSSQLQLLGIGGNNIKILIDGVPINGRSGLSFDIDQIDPSTIEQIEIIEGPTSTEFGSNALAGVINFRTKTQKDLGTNFSLSLREELPIKQVFSLQNGRHQFALNSQSKPNEKISFNTNLSLRKLGGSATEENKRSQNWDPKSQLNFGIGALAAVKGIEIKHDLNLLLEEIVDLQEYRGIIKPQALDQHYKTVRVNNALGLSKKFKFTEYSIQSNLTYYKRTTHFFLSAPNEERISRSDLNNESQFLKSNQILSKVAHQFGPKFQLEAGSDLLYEEVNGKRISSDAPAAKEIGFWSKAEWQTTKNISTQFGVRKNFSNLFKNPLLPTASIKLLQGNNTLTATYAQGFRQPSLRELYFTFNDASHNIIGNKNLIPEKSHYYDAQFQKRFKSNELQVKVFYTSIENKIDFAQSLEDASQLTLLNIYKQNNLGGRFSYRTKFKSFNIQSRISLIRLNYILETESDNKQTNLEYSLKAQWEINNRLQLSAIYEFNQINTLQALSINSELQLLSNQLNFLSFALKYQVSKKLTLRVFANDLIKNKITTIPIISGSVGHTNSSTTGLGTFLGLSINYKFNLNK